jgi:hypothetical protein
VVEHLLSSTTSIDHPQKRTTKNYRRPLFWTNAPALSPKRLDQTENQNGVTHANVPHHQELSCYLTFQEIEGER